MKTQAKTAGFTLIELILVVGIILGLGIMSTAFYSRSLTQNNVSNAADQIAEELHKAQIYAMTGKQNTGWGVRFNANTITFFASGLSGFEENFPVSPSVNITGLTQIIFAKTTCLPQTNATINISGAGNSRTITINSAGGISR